MGHPGKRVGRLLKPQKESVKPPDGGVLSQPSKQMEDEFSKALGWVNKELPENATKREIFQSFREAYEFVVNETKMEAREVPRIRIDIVPDNDEIEVSLSSDYLSGFREHIFEIRRRYVYLIFGKWWKDGDFRAVMFDSIEMFDLGYSSDFLLKWWRQARAERVSQSKLLEYTKEVLEPFSGFEIEPDDAEDLLIILKAVRESDEFAREWTSVLKISDLDFYF